ncbi:MAG: AAA family ATPase, partial [Acidobacteriia bacterium]|nr:AAA family ATPase [Terriglobia bacterium]
DLAERLGLDRRDLARRVREYSRGMRQKLGLVAALQHDAEVLILDEPTTGLDPLVREVVFDLLRQAGRDGKTVFHSSHVLTEVERTCTRVGILRAGRLVSVARTEEVRRASVRRMVVRFAHPVPAEEFALPDVEVVEMDGSRVVLKVAAGLDPLLGVLARHPVLDLAFPEPSLKEAFVDLYRATPEGAR